MKEVYQMNLDELFEQRKATKEGLSSRRAQELLEEVGENVLKEGKRKGIFQIFLEQFADLMVIILIIAAVISMVSGNLESTLVIFVVLILNALLGTVQYLKAEKSLASLKALSSPHAKVIRDGRKIEIDSKQVVPGDILPLEAGDLICADARIINNYSLQVNESSLTGESTNVDKSDAVIEKEVALADRSNMVYSGSLVTYGRATVLVTGTGMDTEIGKIAQLMNATKEKKTPLQISLEDFSKKLAIVIMCISLLVFVLSLYRHMPLIDSMMFAVALAVAAIPEALGSIVTIVQAMGTQKMASENAIIKELKAVESLGCVSVICSDKTGTLTQNKMTVQEIYLGGKLLKPDDFTLTNQMHRYLLYNAVLNNDSAIVDGKGIGDPTEFCLLEMAGKAGFDKAHITGEDIRGMMGRIEEIAFDSDRKLMSTKYLLHGIPTVLTKGAVDVLLKTSVAIRSDEGVRPITKEDIKAIEKQNQLFSENGLRVLAFAYREVDDNHVLTVEEEKDFVFLGLISMIDPPREESKEAVANAKMAGIKPIMITGDHKVTATAIAAQIGIFEEGDISLTGSELDTLKDEELDRELEKISVYARVSPENKIRIVDAWQRRGCICSMTGDGVNDAPALKKADIGVAMGITGTEVSKDAASMILTDDNFATIIKAVLNGRNVYRNIKNAIQFLLSGNMAGILAVLYCSVMALPAPFAAVHLLFINLLTDSLPALAIGMEPSDKTLLKEKPRSPEEKILNNSLMGQIFLQGALIAAVTMVAFYKGYSISPAMATTMAFATLTVARLFHGFNCRSRQSITQVGLLTNKWTIGAFFLGLLLINAVLFLPFLRRVFEVTALSGENIVWIYCLAFIPTLCIQLVKIFRGK